MRFKAKVVQVRPDLVTVTADLDLWHGRKLKAVPGGDGVRLEVGVYAPDDPECRGERVATYTGPKREIRPMEVPIRERAFAEVAVPPSERPYNVVVQLVGGPVKGGPVGIKSKKAAQAMPEVRPIVFSSERVPASLGFQSRTK